MSRTAVPRARALALGLALAGALVLAAAVWALAAEELRARRRAPPDALRIEELTSAVKSDASAAPALAAEQKRQTEAALARDVRARLLAWLLICGAAATVAGTKWRLALGGERTPGRERLVLLRRAQAEPWPATPGDGSDLDPGPGLDFVRELVARVGTGREVAIPILQAIQAHYSYLPDEALQLVCELTEITPAQIAGNSTFYADFRRSPVGRHVLRVCHGTACHVSGAGRLTSELRRALGIPPGADTDPARRATVDRVACLGCCSLAPVLVLDQRTAGHLTPADVPRLVGALGAGLAAEVAT